MAELSPDAFGFSAAAGPKELDPSAFGFGTGQAIAQPEKPSGGLAAAAKQAIGATIKGAGQAASDFIPGVTTANPVTAYGQSVIDANPTAVQSLGDIVESPWLATKEAIGNAAGSMTGMVGSALGAKAVGGGLSAIAPFTGPAAPVVGGVGKLVSTFGPGVAPIVTAALPSYGAIREEQIKADPANEADARSKAIAALGAGTVGAIETRFGPQEWALSAMKKGGIEAVAKNLADAKSIPGAIGKGIVRGGAIEGAEELVQNPIEQLASYQDPTTKQAIGETLFGGAMGAIGGGALGGGMAGVAKATYREPTPVVEVPPVVAVPGAVDQPAVTVNPAAGPLQAATVAGIQSGAVQQAATANQVANEANQIDAGASAPVAPAAGQGEAPVPEASVPSASVSPGVSTYTTGLAGAATGVGSLATKPADVAPTTTNAPAAPNGSMPTDPTAQVEPAGAPTSNAEFMGDADPMYGLAVKAVQGIGSAWSADVADALKIGYNRAARLIEQMERDGIVSPMDASGARTVTSQQEQQNGNQAQVAKQAAPGREAQPAAVSDSGVAPAATGEVPEKFRRSSGEVSGTSEMPTGTFGMPTGIPRESPGKKSGNPAGTSDIENDAAALAAQAAKLRESASRAIGSQRAKLTALADRMDAARSAIVAKANAPIAKKSQVASSQSPTMRRDDLVGAIMRVTGGNGIAASMAQDIAGDKAGSALAKLRGLFTNRGTSDLGDVAMLLREEESFDVRDGNHLSELIRSASAGDVAVSMDRSARDAESDQEKRHRDRIRAQAKKYKLKTDFVKFSDLETRVLDMLEQRHNRAVAALDDRAKKRFDAALERSYSLVSEDEVDAVLVDVNGRGFRGRSFWNEATKLLRGMNDDAAARQMEDTIDAAVEGPEPDWLKDDDGRGNQPTGSGDEANRGDQTEAPGFGLTGQSAEDVARQEADRVAAEKAAKEEADRDAAEKVAAEKKSIADKIKARAENPDNFQFGEGAKEAAKPMGGLFDQPIPAGDGKFANKGDGLNDASRELRSLSHDRDGPGDVALGNGKYVSFDDAVRVVREGVESGAIKPWPAQLNILLDMTFRDVDRVLAEAKKEGKSQANQPEQVAQDYEEGDEITFAPHAVSNLTPAVSGILTAKQSAGNGRFRLTIRTDKKAPQGGGNVTVTVYSQNGKVARIGDGLNKPQPTAEPEKYRYALVNRPASMGAVPKVQFTVEPRPPAGSPHHDLARHGIMVTDRKLTDQEISSFELAVIADKETENRLADDVAKQFGEYAEQWIEDQKDDPRGFAAAVGQSVEKITGNVRHSIGDIEQFANAVLRRLKDSQKPADPEQRSTINQAFEEGQKKADEAVATPALQSVSINQFKHTKTGVMQFSVAFKDRVSPEVFARAKSIASLNKSRYSAFKGGGASPGFLFTSESLARQFAVEIDKLAKPAATKAPEPTGLADNQVRLEGVPYIYTKHDDGKWSWHVGSNRPNMLGSDAEIIPKLEAALAAKSGRSAPADDFNAMFDDIMGEIAPEESAPAAPKSRPARPPSAEPSAPRAPRTPRASQPTRTAGEAAASAASNLAGGFGDITNALGALFGTKSGGRLSTGLSFDEDTYAKALPLFKSAVSKFKAAGQDLRELMKALMLDVQRKFGSDTLRNMQPYVVRFMEDVRAGKVNLGESNDRGTEGEGGKPLEAVAPEEVGGAGGRGQSGRGTDDSGNTSGKGNPPVDGRGGEAGRGGRDRPAGVHPAEAGAEGKNAGGKDAGEGVPSDLRDTPGSIPESNFEIDEDVALGSGGQMTKYRDNVAAIRLLKTLEAERRRATDDEKRILARYVGWGGIPNAFQNRATKEVKAGWEEHVAELQALLTPAELNAASASSLNAHFTSKDVVDFMWQAVRRLGFNGGMVLEPSIGVGNFVGLMPREVAGKSFVTGIELDSLTSRMAAALYPRANIINSGFQDSPLPEKTFSLAIGNPPFGSESMRFRHRPELNGASIHNQFFLGSMDAVEPGGIMAMVVSRHLLDAQDASTRQRLAKMAELIGAVRLPGSAFKGNALTEVVTDVLFFRRRDAESEASIANALAVVQTKAKASDLSAMARKNSAEALLRRTMEWTGTENVKDPLGGEDMLVGAYFAKHPEMVMGVMDRSGTMRHKGNIDVKLSNGESLASRLSEAIKRLPEVEARDISDEALARSEEMHQALGESLLLSASGAEAGSIRFEPDGSLSKVVERIRENGESALKKVVVTKDTPWSPSLFMGLDGKWYRLVPKLKEDGKPVKSGSRNVYVKDVFASDADVPAGMRLGESKFERIKSLIEIRDLLMKQINLEVGRSSKEAMEENRARLRDAYDAFVEKHGFISESKNASIVAEMPDEGLLLSLESGFKKEVTAAKAKRTGMNASPARASKAAILSRPVAIPPVAADYAENAVDALAISMSETGRVSVKRIAALRGISEEEAAEELTGGESPLAFVDPEQGYEIVERNAYLSGNVRRKLEAAKGAELQANISALQAVQPEQWTSDKVRARIGANWIPTAIYAEFAGKLLDSKARVTYSELTNVFQVTGDFDTAAATTTWGTKRIPFTEILTAMLNSSRIAVYDTDSDGNRHFNQTETDAANDKKREISEAFDDWVFKDSDRRKSLTQLFNDKFNTRVNRQYDGSHLSFPGKVPDQIISLRRGQKNAVWRGIIEDAVLYDHAVGAGKTFTGIARAMERRRMGLSKKPMVVVPNHMVSEWATQAYRLYPGAKILAAGTTDMSARNRRRLFAKIASGDWDLVIVPHSSFQFIPISKATEERFLSQELEVANSALKEAEADADPSSRFKPLSVKAAEALIKKIEERLAKVRSKTGKDMLLTFEQMGVDDLSVDESHEFKNLFYSTRLTDVRGMGPASGSGKAFDLYTKMRVIREANGSSVFMTGTPISNSAVEMYTIMRYLAPEFLEDSGLEHFDAFRSQFVEALPKLEPTDSGVGLKLVTRLGREWSNMRALMEGYYTVADVVTNDDIKRWYAEDNPGKEFPLPKVKGGDRRVVAVQPTPTQLSILMESIVPGFESLPNIQDTKERNATRLRLMDQARKLSLHAKAVNPDINDEPGGKLDKAVDEIAAIYHKWTADKGTQLVFLDRGVPKSRSDLTIIKEYDALKQREREAISSGDEDAFQEVADLLEKFDANEIDELRAAQHSGWSGYQHIKDGLIAKGIPANEIAFIQNFSNDADKRQLFDAVNDGSVRVLIGSTPRMGAGTNVQERLVALHHIDATWKPSDIEQREGRIIRQGNSLLEKYGKDFEVEILAYVTERTVDAKLWDLNSMKLRMVNGIRYYDGQFEMDFDDEAAVGMAEIAAIASGDPLLLERFKLENEIDVLLRQKRSHARRIEAAEDALEQARRIAGGEKGRLARYDEDADFYEAARKFVASDAWSRSVTINGKEYSHSDLYEARRSIDKAAEGVPEGEKPSITINGKEFTSVSAADEAVAATLGDAEPFVAEVDGKRIIRRSEFARAMRDVLGSEFSPTKETPVGTIAGIPVSVSATQGYVGGTRFVNLSAEIPRGDGSRGEVSGWADIATSKASKADAPAILTVTNLRPAIGRFEVDLSRKEGSAAGRARIEKEAEKARNDIPTLEEALSEPFKHGKELEDKRARLSAVEAELNGRKASGAASDDTGDVVGNVGEAGVSVSPADSAIYSMAQEGKSAAEILSFIGKASRRPFNRYLANALRNLGAASTITLDSQGGFGFGNRSYAQKYAAAYNPKTDTVALFTPREAERHTLHELVHAATLKAIAKGGPASMRMRALFWHVQKSGGLDGQYGMSSLDEFVAEAFSNPKFQQALRNVPAPKVSTLKNAWQWFVQAVARILGLRTPAMETALDRAMTEGAALMRENASLMGEGGEARHSQASETTDIRFNIADSWPTSALPQTSAIRSTVANAMRSDASTSWITPFNTQYHKAEKWAAEGKVRFKRVFDLVQRFLGDVSRFAVMAQNEAPTLFHEWRNLADVKRTLTSGDVLGKQHRADVAAIASPLYEGTLYGGGNPLSGIKWTDDQLSSRFNLTARQIKLYHEALAAVKVSMDEMAKSIVAQHAKRESTAVDDGMSLEDMAASAVARLRDRQDALREEIGRVAQEVRADQAAMAKEDGDSQKAKELQAKLSSLMRDNNAEIDRLNKVADDISGVVDKNQKLQAAGYFPLMRFGKHTVTAKDADGKVQFFGMYEGMPLVPRSGQYEANKVAAELRAEFPEWTVTTGIKNDEKYKLYQGLNIEAIQLFADHMDKEGLEPFQEFIRLATNNRSAQRRLLHRQGTPGFDTDVRRTLAQFVVSNARATSSNYHTQDMLRAAADAEKDGGDIGSEAIKLVEYVRNPAEEAQALRGFLFFQFLGGSLASALVNLTQTPMMTLPHLAKFESAQRVTRRLLAASKMAAGNPADMPAGALRDALLRAEMDGVTAPQEIHQLTATAANNIFAGSRLANGLLRGWGAPFAMAESFNRRIAFIAAFQIAEAMSPAELARTGFKDAFEFAEDAVKQTQGIYNKGNRMNVGRGSVGSVLMTFKQYSIMYLELLKRLPPKQRAIMVGVLLIAAGGGGLPGVEDVEDLIDTIGQWLGFATNSRRTLRNTLTEWVGRDGSDIVLNGLLSRVGVDMHSRMGMQNLIPGTGILKQSSVDKGRDIEEFFGPAASVVKSLGDALEGLATGHPDRAVKAIAPGAVRNAMQGAGMAATGYAEDAKGRRTVPANGLESAAKAVGFNPKVVADYGAVKRDIAQDQRLVGVKREEFTSAIADAILSGDTEARMEAMNDMAKWNRDNPTLRFTIAPGAIVKRVKEARTEGATRFLKSVPKGMRSQAIEEMRQ